MSKSGHFKGNSPRRKKKTQVWQLLLAVIVVAAVASTWMFIGRSPSVDESTAAEDDESAMQPVVTPGLEDRMVLPAKPQRPRPATLSPAAFSEPETKASYQAAKNAPEVLENLPCYCGCFANAGHRNNLDCFKDNHGVSCQLCRAIALEGERQGKMGTPVQQIKRSIDERYAPRIR